MREEKHGADDEDGITDVRYNLRKRGKKPKWPKGKKFKRNRAEERRKKTAASSDVILPDG